MDIFYQSHKKPYIFWISVFFVWFTLEKISIQTRIVKAFPQKIVASMLFLIKMATNELICHYIEVIKTSIITVVLAI